MNVELWKEYGHKVKVLTDSFGRTRYLLAIGAVGTHYYLVSGDCLQDAIDFVVDIEGENIPGFFGSDEDTKAYWNEDHEDHTYAQDMFLTAGNAGELFTQEIVVIAENNRRWR